MTKVELINFAYSHDIPVTTSMLKADIIATIKGAMGWM